MQVLWFVFTSIGISFGLLTAVFIGLPVLFHAINWVGHTIGVGMKIGFFSAIFTERGKRMVEDNIDPCRSGIPLGAAFNAVAILVAFAFCNLVLPFIVMAVRLWW